MSGLARCVITFRMVVYWNMLRTNLRKYEPLNGSIDAR